MENVSNYGSKCCENKHNGIKKIIYSLIVDYHKFVRWGQK